MTLGNRASLTSLDAPAWQGVREHRGWLWIGLGVVALGIYGFVATL